jgi:histidine ammonia-lyase
MRTLSNADSESAPIVVDGRPDAHPQLFESEPLFTNDLDPATFGPCAGRESACIVESWEKLLS